MSQGSFKGANFGYWSGSEDEETADSPGGYFSVFLAGATLLIGDLVYLSAAHTVNKSVTQTLYTAGIGVVIGGDGVYMQVLQDDTSIGFTAGLVNQRVIVGVVGKFKVLSDSAITLGAVVTGGTVTAGRAKTDVTAQRLMATALETASGAAEKILALFTGIH